jgi:hypothetical protein
LNFWNGFQASNARTWTPSWSTRSAASRRECGWHELATGALLASAEAEGFEAFVTTDQNLRYQQKATLRRIAIVVLSTTDWRRIRRHAHLVASALDGIAPGEFAEVLIPTHE